MTPSLNTLEDHFALAWRGLRQGKRARGSLAAGTVAIEEHSPFALPTDVVALLDGGTPLSLQLGAAWFEHFARTVAPAGTRAILFVLRRGGVAMVALPVLTAAGHGAAVRRVDALANYYTAVFAPALHPTSGAAELAMLVRAILQRHPRMASLRLAPMAPEHPSHAITLEALALSGLVAFPFFAFGNWFRNTRGLRWAGLHQGLGSRLRNTLQRRGKKFRSDGGNLEIVTGGERLETALAAYQSVYARSWKQPEPYPEFMPGLVRLCAARGWLRLGVAWLGEQPIAAQVWMVGNGRADIYKLAYDERFPQYSAGSLLTAALLQHVLDVDQVNEVDYLIGDDPYKQEWVDQRRERWGLTAYNPRTLAGWSGIARECAGRTLKLLGLRKAPGAPSGGTK